MGRRYNNKFSYLKRKSLICCWQRASWKPLWKTLWHHLVNQNMSILLEPAILLPSISPEKLLHIWMRLFPTAERKECLPASLWINKLQINCDIFTHGNQTPINTSAWIMCSQRGWSRRLQLVWGDVSNLRYYKGLSPSKSPQYLNRLISVLLKFHVGRKEMIRIKMSKKEP